MIRRLSLAAVAIVAVSALTSCATFDRNDAAATVGGVEISRDSLTDISQILAADPQSEAALRLGVVDLGTGLVDATATRYVLQVLVHDELLRQYLASVGASPSADDLAAAEARVDGSITGDIRPIYVQEEALRSALLQLPAEQQDAFAASIPASKVSIDSRYGGWDNTTGTIVPLG